MSQHPISKQRREQLLEVAADWVVRVQSGELSPQELGAWIEWFDASPEHRRAFGDVGGTWRDLGELTCIEEPSDADVAGDPYDGEVPIAVWRKRGDPRESSRKVSTPITRWTMAATVVLGMGALWFFQSEDGTPTHYTTVIAQHQSVELPDGSRVELGAVTNIDVAYSDIERRIYLYGGTAYFTVEHDPGRPFVVAAGGGSVRAIGTEFNVQRSSQSVTVVVADGLVEVHNPLSAVAANYARQQPQWVQLPAGQQVSYSAGTGLDFPITVNVASATAWREGRLVIQGKTLEMAIADVNRYAALPIEIGDTAVGDLEVSGYVLTGEIDGWLEGLETVFPINVERQDDRVVIYDRE